jgi:Holliday junction resolvase RusA-like endonuclease
VTALLDITIGGMPVGQGRPRAVRTPMGVRMHPAKKSAQWQALAAEVMREQWGEREPYAEPVRLVVIAVGARGSVVIADGIGRRWRTSKPDVDNVVKAVADAIVAAGVIVDDTFVCELVARSERAADGEEPHVQIALGPLPPKPHVADPGRERIANERAAKAAAKEQAKAERARIAAEKAAVKAARLERKRAKKE